MMEASPWKTGFLLAAILLFASATALAQSPVKTYTPPKPVWGEPDLQGIFTNATGTPFVRPPDLSGKAVLTANEVAQLEARGAQNRGDQPPSHGDPATQHQC